MRRRLELLDTSILVELLEVPGEHEHLDEIQEEFTQRQETGTFFQIPAATIVETGAHIIRISNGDARRDCARTFESVLRQTYEGMTPWTFAELAWDRDFIAQLLNPSDDYQQLASSLAKKTLEMGDLVILAELRLLRTKVDLSVIEVDVWTRDAGLRAAVDALTD